MGKVHFMDQVAGKSAEDAFRRAQYYANLIHGQGYILEKNSFKLLLAPRGVDPKQFAKELLADENHWLQDPAAPAGCIYVGPRIEKRPILKKREIEEVQVVFRIPTPDPWEKVYVLRHKDGNELAVESDWEKALALAKKLAKETATPVYVEEEMRKHCSKSVTAAEIWPIDNGQKYEMQKEELEDYLFFGYSAS